MVKCDDGAGGRRKRDREMGQLETGLTQRGTDNEANRY